MSDRPMNRIDAAFARLKAQKQKAFIPYLAAGVPGKDETVELVLELEKMGADIVELGYPFSDPMADGAVNQAAANRALENNIDDVAYFEMIKGIRKHSQIPLVVFSYLNPIFRLGLKDFAERAKAAGVDGFLLVDMPAEESEEMVSICKSLNLSFIFLAAPTTTPQRLQTIIQASSGFLYYISRTGITGEQDDFQADFESKLKAIKSASPIPVVVGFGISTPAHVRTVCSLCDGAVVGSAIVRRTLDRKPFAEVLQDIKKLTQPLIAPTKEIWN